MAGTSNANYDKWGVNPDKEIQIAFAAKTTFTSEDGLTWNSWRTSSNVQGLTVNDNVKLVLTEPLKVKSNITYETTDADNVMNSGAGKMITDFTQAVNGAVKSAAAISNVIGKGSAHGTDTGDGKGVKRNGDAKNQLQSGLNTLAKDATEGKFASKYQHFKVAKGAKSGGISSLTFSFKWGNADLYDSWEEVVKPILTLSSYLQPKFATDKDGTGSTNMLLMPFPNYYQYQTAFYESLAETISNNVSGLEAAADLMAASEKAGGEKGNDAYSAGYATGSNGGQTEEERQKQEQEQKDKEAKEKEDKNASNSAMFGENGKASYKASTALGALNSLVASMWAACDKAITASVTKATTDGMSPKFLFVKVGKSVWGPYTVQQADWEFDFTNVDENGFPIAGTISYSNIEPLVLEEYNDTIRHWTKGKYFKDVTPEYNKLYQDLITRDGHKATSNATNAATTEGGNAAGSSSGSSSKNS